MDEENKKKEMRDDSDVRLTYQNMLWILYRALAEDIITTEELEKIGYKII